VARKGLIQSNERKKDLVSRSSQKRDRLKKCIMDRSLPLEERFEATIKLAQMPRNTAQNRVRLRCFLTGRPRGVYRFSGLSRVIWREKASKGELPGIRRSSW
jgi:small subunit ribosomal protein S14